MNHRPTGIVPDVSRGKNRVRDMLLRGGYAEGSEGARAAATIAEIATDSKSLAHSTLILATRRVPSEKKKRRPIGGRQRRGAPRETGREGGEAEESRW